MKRPLAKAAAGGKENPGDLVSPEFSTGRVMEPWDILRGRCIFKDKQTLEREVGLADLSHWAPDCATFSRAREIPIKGVENAPKPLRSEEFPLGIPSEVLQMSPKKKRKLEDDTHMANLAAEKCLSAEREKKFFTLEHPGRSLALHLQSWKRLLAEPGVREVKYHTCMFEGSRRKKSQVLICTSLKVASNHIRWEGSAVYYRG